MRITSILGREIYDSRGWPTIQCDIVLDDQTRVSASVPAGMSRGELEAHELRDGDKRLWGHGVTRAVEHLEQKIGPEFIGQEPQALACDMRMIEMDGTDDKSNLGANAMLAMSMAMFRAQAHAEKMQLYELIAHVFGVDAVSLPFPLFNVVNGGLHARNKLPIQEFLIMPVGVSSFRESLELGALVFHTLGNVFEKVGIACGVGDEGGYAPLCADPHQIMDCIVEALEMVEQEFDKRAVIGLDVAAGMLFNQKTSLYHWGDAELDAAGLMQEYVYLIGNYPLYSIEDPFESKDRASWQEFVAALGDRVQVVGDDIFATHAQHIVDGVTEKIATAAVIKPNQVGTISETLQAIRACKQQGINTIVSHRSGETEDTFIADLAVGTSAGQIKAGGLCRSERMAKYNRLLCIEDMLMLALLNP